MKKANLVCFEIQSYVGRLSEGKIAKIVIYDQTGITAGVL